jgi:5'(3')-deoxyribonucleotidase
MNILLDLDGCLCDFFSQSLKDLNWHYRKDNNKITINQYIETQNPNMHEVFGITKTQFWAAIDYPNFWYYLQPFPWAKKLVKYLKSKGTVTIATAPGHIRSFSEKASWLQTHLDINRNDIMIGKHKWLMAREDAVLIDDLPENIKKFRAYGGNAILVPSNWNTRNLSYEHVLGAIEEAGIL